jgi:hypothetical protein
MTEPELSKKESLRCVRRVQNVTSVRRNNDYAVNSLFCLMQSTRAEDRLREPLLDILHGGGEDGGDDKKTCANRAR